MGSRSPAARMERGSRARCRSPRIPPHQGMQRLVRDLNRLRQTEPALMRVTASRKASVGSLPMNLDQSVVAVREIWSGRGSAGGHGGEFHARCPGAATGSGCSRQDGGGRFSIPMREIYGGTGIGNLGGVGGGEFFFAWSAGFGGTDTSAACGPLFAIRGPVRRSLGFPPAQWLKASGEKHV